jgi:sugar phosphate isomerase/epimerase
MTTRDKCPDMELSVCVWRPDTSAEGICRMADAGVVACEPGPSLLTDYDKPGVEAIGARFREAGIRLYSCHLPFEDSDDLSVFDSISRLRALNRQRQRLRHAAAAGVEVAVLHPGGAVKPGEVAARLDNFRAALEPMVRTARETGVRLALENMPPGLLGAESTTIRTLVDEFDDPFLGVCFDAGHANLIPEGVHQAHATLADRVVNYHLHDNDATYDKHVQPPYGTIDWERFARELRGRQIDFPVAIEAPPWKRSGLGQMLREVEAVLDSRMPAIELGAVSVYATCRRCGHRLFGEPGDWFCACPPAG